jgi:hypothetical protein
MREDLISITYNLLVACEERGVPEEEVDTYFQEIFEGIFHERTDRFFDKPIRGIVEILRLHSPPK